MSIADVLRAQFKEAHELLERVVDDCDDATLRFVAEGSTIGSIAAIYLHAVYDEDLVVASAMGTSRVYERADWAGRLPIPGGEQDLEWARSASIDMTAARGYAHRVYEATDAALAAAPDDAWMVEVETFMGPMPRAQFLGAIAVVHLAGHQGEISAIKGSLGLKGFPF